MPLSTVPASRTTSQWSDEEAARFGSQGPLGERVYTSRLLGADPNLVLHGGGNTSVKLAVPNRFGEEEEILFVKGSGWDLASIEAQGFAPVRRLHLLRLLTLDRLSDADMVRELRLACTDPGCPAPSVESILHALIPYRYVDHTHADALVAITNTARGREYVEQVYGSEVIVVPYVMPGFDLAKVCSKLFPPQLPERVIGVVLLNHGLFTFGNTARESYERMINLVARAEAFLERRTAQSLTERETDVGPAAVPRVELAALRREASAAAGFPLLLRVEPSARARAFARRPDLSQLALQGPATPDHVLRTKRLPLLDRDVTAYAAAYGAAFETYSRAAHTPLSMLDPAPRVVLDPAFGLATLGRTARDTEAAAEIYLHTIDVILAAHALGGYRALTEKEILDVEYWDLEQAKLRAAGAPKPMAGEVALVTGAASGIGRACAEAFLARGAAVIAMDLDPTVAGLRRDPSYLGLTCDVTDPTGVRAALHAAARAFGGLDMLVLNAGVFPSSARIESLDDVEWSRAMRVNLDANLVLLREAHPLLKLAPNGGRVVAIGSRNVSAPGVGAAAYSASKAALTQLARVAALEWAADGIRVNVVHPDAVFDTGLWTEEVLHSRAASYGLTVEDYKRRNLLRTEIRSADVARLVVEMCGPTFSRTTGAQVPIDGGNERVI